MKTNRVAAIGAIFVFIIGGISLGVITLSRAAEETIRFESVTTASTQDDVEVNVRIIGSHAKRHQTAMVRSALVRAVREKLATVKYADIPKKPKLLFRKELNYAEDNGVTIDVFHIYIPDEE